MTDDTPQSRGGHSRRESLTPIERREIAMRAARARWQQPNDGDEIDLPKATHQGKMPVGGLELDCYVLEECFISVVWP